MHFKVVLDTEKIVWFENEYNKNSNIAYLSGVPDKIPKKSLENFAIKTNSFIKNISNWFHVLQIVSQFKNVTMHVQNDTSVQMNLFLHKSFIYNLIILEVLKKVPQ